MITNAIAAVLSLTAVDATARRVVAQSGCSDDWLATVKNLKEINELLYAKRLELKKKLGINEHKYQLKIKKDYHRLARIGGEIPPVMLEYITLGKQISRLNQEYARIMRENNAELSPGAIRRKEKQL